MRGIVQVAVGVCLSACCGVAYAQSTYVQVGSFAPVPASLWTPGADGRIWAVNGSQILRQDTLHGATYSVVGSLASGFSALGAMSASPDGSSLVFMDGVNLRVLSTASLSVSSPSSTTSFMVPGVRNASGSIGFVGSSVYVSSTIPALPPTGPQPNPSYLTLSRVDLSSSTVTTVASIEAFSSPNYGHVGAFGDRLFWSPMYSGPDSTRLLQYSIADLNSAVTPLGVGNVVQTLNIPLSELIVDGNGTALYISGSGFVGSWSDPASSGGLLSSPHSRIAYSAATGEVLSRPDFPPQITRWSIPTPGTAVGLAMGGLLLGRRRR